MSTQGFASKVAVVTGAGVGIGYEIARQLALQGAYVVLNDIDQDAAKQAADSITAEGGVCHAMQGDVADVSVVRGLVERAVVTFGRLDIAVSNAGLTSWGGFFDYEPEQFDRVLGVNLRGTYFLTQAAARQMRKQGDGGRIVLISSLTGRRAVPNLSAYGMTKAAVEAIARTLVVELSPCHITINAVAPGPTVTPRTLAGDPNYATAWGQLTPMQRATLPSDIANAVLFFLSPEAEHVTGQTLIVDGGWSSRSPIP